MIEPYVRKWLPSDWLDEYVPQTGNHPSEFIGRLDDGAPCLRRLSSDREDDSWTRGLTIGDRVQFCWTEFYGDFIATKHDDGSITTDEVIPATANCFRLDGLNETIQPSIGDLLQEEEPGQHEIDAYCWSDAQPWRLEPTDEGFAFVRENTGTGEGDGDGEAGGGKKK